MVGVPHLATFHSTTKAMMSKVLLRGRGGVDRQNLSGQNIYFLHGTGQRLFPYIHKNKTHRVARLTHDRKVADSVPPVQRTMRDRTCAVSE